MPRILHFTNELANSLLENNSQTINQHWTIQNLQQRLHKSLGSLPPWGKTLIRAIHQHYTDEYPDIKRDELSLFIRKNPLFKKVWEEQRESLKIKSYALKLPITSFPIVNCDAPRFNTLKDLASFFGISPQQLEGFADTHGFEAKSALPHQRHYHYLWKKKPNRNSSGKDRLLEIPKSNLRAIQRQINTQILQKIPLHSACHGFRKDHSCITYVQPHCHKRVVIRMDLERFFTSIPLRRIHAIFETIGYQTAVARLLTGLCSNQTPRDVLQNNHQLSWREQKQYTSPHLPQGAPCSPALANLAAFKLDIRLASLMKKMGGDYTRYADDLAFSGDFATNTLNKLHAMVCHIAMDEGFSMNTRKTKFMRQGIKQQLTGLVLNQHVNYPRHKYDLLKAILYNCVRLGAESQNRQQHKNFKAHLQGKIAHVHAINPQRAIRLRQLFKQINWN